MNGIEGFQQKEMLIFLKFIEYSQQSKYKFRYKNSSQFFKESIHLYNGIFTTETHIKRIQNYKMVSDRIGKCMC